MNTSSNAVCEYLPLAVEAPTGKKMIFYSIGLI